jgi:hypothetical protein
VDFIGYYSCSNCNCLFYLLNGWYFLVAQACGGQFILLTLADCLACSKREGLSAFILSMSMSQIPWIDQNFVYYSWYYSCSARNCLFYLLNGQVVSVSSLNSNYFGKLTASLAWRVRESIIILFVLLIYESHTIQPILPFNSPCCFIWWQLLLASNKLVRSC